VPLGDRFDRKTLVLVQIGFAGMFALVASLAPRLPVLLAASFGLGLVSCVPQQLVPFAATMSPADERGRSVGTVVSGIMMGLLLGRTVGGALSSLSGWRPVFAAAAAFMAVMAGVAAYVLPHGRPSTNLPYGRLLASMWPLLRDHRALRRAMLTQALIWVAFNAFWANLASMLADDWRLGPFWAGGFGLVGLVGALAAGAGGRAADRIGPMRVLAFSIAMVTLSYFMMFAAPVSMPLLILAVILLDLGCQSALVSNQTRIFALDLHAQGRLNTLYMTVVHVRGD
jgi:predicted MFS family arabinose efflux permease